MTAELGFFTVSAGGHNIYTVPWVCAALLTHKDAMAEVIVSKKDIGTEPLVAVKQLFGDRLILRAVPERYAKWRKIPKDKRSMIGGELYAGRFPHGSIRWLERPQLPTKYIYISDDDILNMDYDIVERHLDIMSKLGKPYSNIMRADTGPAQQKMSGLMFVDAEKFYTPDYAAAQQRQFTALDSGDFTWYCERLLYRLIADTHGLPPIQFTGWMRLRPLHGVHICCTRPPTNWNINMRTVLQWRDLKTNPLWRKMTAFFAPQFVALCAVLDAQIVKDRY